MSRQSTVLQTIEHPEVVLTQFSLSTLVHEVCVRSLVKKENITVDYKPEMYCRASHSDLESDVQRIWREKSKNPKLFNGSKYRLHSFGESEARIILKLGLTDYRDVCGTNLSPSVSWWADKGSMEGNSQKYMADALGVGALTFTSDGFLTVIRRAEWTGVYAGKLDRPGGHPEPSNVSDCLVRTADEEFLEEKISDEIWNSVIDEMVGETGIPRAAVQEQSLLGLVRNKAAGGRPSLEFVVRLNIQAHSVRALYNEGHHVEADESTSLILIPPQLYQQLLLHSQGNSSSSSEDVISGSLLSATEVWNESTPALRGSLIMLNLSKEYVST